MTNKSSIETKPFPDFLSDLLDSETCCFAHNEGKFYICNTYNQLKKTIKRYPVFKDVLYSEYIHISELHDFEYKLYAFGNNIALYGRIYDEGETLKGVILTEPTYSLHRILFLDTRIWAKQEYLDKIGKGFKILVRDDTPNVD